jgi:ActR/RegA family two-component response regulator
VTAPLYLIQDDLFFAERVRGAARRLGLDLVALAPAEAGGRTWDTDSVVVVQVTLNPDRQLALVERLLQSKPAPRVIAVTGHLETELRVRARALGAVLAAHSSMERVLARACGLSPAQ